VGGDEYLFGLGRNPDNRFDTELQQAFGFLIDVAQARSTSFSDPIFFLIFQWWPARKAAAESPSALFA